MLRVSLRHVEHVQGQLKQGALKKMRLGGFPAVNINPIWIMFSPAYRRIQYEEIDTFIMSLRHVKRVRGRLNENDASRGLFGSLGKLPRHTAKNVDNGRNRFETV